MADLTPEERAGLLRVRAGMARLGAAHLELTAASILAADRIQRFGKALERGFETAFLELVVRYDEPADPLPRPSRRRR